MKTWLWLFFLACVSLSCERNEPEITNELKGQWIWKSTCGGIVGCVTATVTTFRILTIADSEMKITENGDLTFRDTYQINSLTNEDDSKVYEIEFSDGMIWKISVSGKHLAIEYSFLISVYKRL